MTESNIEIFRRIFWEFEGDKCTAIAPWQIDRGELSSKKYWVRPVSLKIESLSSALVKGFSHGEI